MENMEELLQYFQKTCRICLCTGVLHEFTEDVVEFYEAIKIENVEDDKLPKTICQNCNKKATEALKIIKTAKDSNNYLNQLVEETPDDLPIDSEVIVTTETGENLLLNLEDLNTVEVVLEAIDQPLKTCQKCNKQVRSLSIHYKQSKSCHPIECNLCGKPFKRMKQYRYHLKMHEKLIGAEFHCFYCGKDMPDEPTYKSHLFIHKFVNVDNPKKCNICHKVFSSKANLIRHMYSHDPEKRFACDICNKMFPDSVSLKKHAIVHSSVRYKCEFCGKLFKNRCHYEIHEAIHQNLSPYRCEVCNRQYSKKYLLDTHIFEKHTNNLYKCKFCDEQFRKKSALITHEDAHRGKVPQCQICGNIFKNKFSLHTHVKSHVLEECPHCKKFFAKTYIKRHIMVHTGEKPYKCEHCDKEFRQQVHYKTHVMAHNGEYRHKCDFCDRKFIFKESFMSHVRTHTGERFKCVFCEKEYRDQSSLKKHLLKTHTI